MAEDWIQAFGPNADDLLDLLLPQMDDGMLIQIASADYGNEVEQHLTPLKVFRDGRIIPVLGWHPAEVLELIRWSEPDEPGWQPGDEGRRGHLLRAFACSLLLRSRERKENDTYDSYGDTAVQLERSIHALGDQFVRPGASFFAWCVQNGSRWEQVGEEKLFFGLALLSLAIRNPEIGEDALVALCRWIDDSVPPRGSESSGWLPVYLRGLKFDRWVQVGEELHKWAEEQPEGDAATWIGLIGRSLAEI